MSVPTAMSTCVVWAENGRFRGVQWNVSFLNTRFHQNFTTSFELLKEAQHAIVTLHVFCVLPCLKQKKVAMSLWELMFEESTKNLWSSKWSTKPKIVSYPVFTRMIPNESPQQSIHPDSGLFWKPSSALQIEWIPKMSISPGRMVGGLEEAGRAASNTAQGVKRPKIGTTEYKRCKPPLENSKNSEKKFNPAKIDGCKMIFSFPTLKFVPFERGASCWLFISCQSCLNQGLNRVHP